MREWQNGTLVDWQLQELATEINLVDPLNYSLINPASIDLRLSNEFIHLPTGKSCIVDYYELEPGHPILASTVEYVRIPEWCCAVLYLKSSAARNGLDHALAGWIDPGFHGQLTLELHAHRDITIVANKCYMQMEVRKLSAVPRKSYAVTGRYNGQLGPTQAR